MQERSGRGLPRSLSCQKQATSDANTRDVAIQCGPGQKQQEQKDMEMIAAD
jgi:hypothetical protein